MDVAVKECVFCFTVCESSSNMDRGITHVTCPRCGQYAVTFEALMGLRNHRASNWPAMSVVLREASDAGQPLEITWDVFEKRLQNAAITSAVDLRMRRMLDLAAKRTRRLGEGVRLHQQHDCPLVHAHDAKEFSTIIHYLTESGHLERDAASQDNLIDVLVTAQGWNLLETTPGPNASVFVAMAFDTEMDPAFEAMARAIQSVGLSAHRVDKREYTHEITDEIEVGLRRCGMVVADVTLDSSGAYFEAGYGMALGRPVIFTVREDRLKEDVHFDTSHFPHIAWKDEADLEERLRRRLEAVIARGGGIP